jgi:voltage-gated potassium channel
VLPLFAAVVLVGVLGFHWIEGYTWLESIWMVVITLTTIGFGEIRPLSDAGRVFVLLLIGGGLSLFSYTLTQLTRYVLEGELQLDLDAQRRSRRMATMQGHFILAGFGRLGAEVAAELVHAGQTVLVIDSDPETAEAAARIGTTFLHGDAGRDAVLTEAHVESAAGLAAATGSNAINILITLSAHHLNPGLRIVTRVDGEEGARKARQAGADAILSPYGLGGTHMANDLLRPETHTFLQAAIGRHQRDFEMVDITVRNDAIVGTLRDLQLRDRFKVTLVAVRKADGTLVAPPAPDQHLHIGDVAIAVGRPEDVRRLRKAAS